MSNDIQLDFQLYVKCPECGDRYDVVSEDYVDQDQLQECVINLVFNNDWKETECDVICHCGAEFKVEGVEY